MKTVRIFLFIFFSIFLFSCINADKSNNNLSIKDRAGNDIILPEKIENIASLTPSATDIILSLGISDKIIAFDSTSKEILYTNNIDVSNIPVFDMLNPDSEKIIAMKPDIVFVNNFSVFSGKTSLDSIKASGICVAVIPSSDTIKSIEDDITFLGNVLNKSDAASNIINIMNKNIENIRTIGESIQNKKKVYFEIAALPNLYSFGTNVYIDDMINIIGASNVFSDKNSWISTSEENILFSNPDIIFTSVDYIDNPTEEILRRKSWQNISAVKNKDVYYIASSSLPTHNIVNAMIMMAKYAYPNEYKDIEIIRN
ncbi:ABC transporter substrate-binding protein [Brachyspira hyodysenteriae]|uniref:Iron ABC transporter substrate-binding protein n=1 Tax=Brachyspira hyodysenteriae ATCC 27164 TaxID=1266923 RepID=A0A3B6VPN6_BRAHO|nr:ABC transporter substrate-binding protein [Brachyspira hyodysenteriae]ANN62352.1 iron ABC transporter substrate-binding protein [Brachyspira hyodysenteriae ATCC 27164]KLI15074.1 iron ABC transporter substrate-binding protein [Brachyspira hyodysenteriae]KLI18695.1 iron ABC transporter substrate-binding protein [Brachyspira hyodysenteriae]KLI18831.1 iron ABC transporter substrate-binding protein [Brachyspira hyodysenteriae]KLI24259.1 iron ABC transporter substrate-binding protein [Brachyspira